MPKHKKQKRRMLNMNVIQEEVRSSLSATTDEEKDHLESDFDIESPEFQVFADDEGWTASVDATYVNLLWATLYLWSEISLRTCTYRDVLGCQQVLY